MISAGKEGFRVRQAVTSLEMAGAVALGYNAYRVRSAPAYRDATHVDELLAKEIHQKMRIIVQGGGFPAGEWPAEPPTTGRYDDVLRGLTDLAMTELMVENEPMLADKRNYAREKIRLAIHRGEDLIQALQPPPHALRRVIYVMGLESVFYTIDGEPVPQFNLNRFQAIKIGAKIGIFLDHLRQMSRLEVSPDVDTRAEAASPEERERMRDIEIEILRKIDTPFDRRAKGLWEMEYRELPRMKNELNRSVIGALLLAADAAVSFLSDTGKGIEQLLDL